mgnify:CR=1 FL=1
MTEIRIPEAVFPDAASRLACFGPGYRSEQDNGGGLTRSTLEAVAVTPVISYETAPSGGGGSQGISQGLHTIDGSIVA